MFWITLFRICLIIVCLASLYLMILSYCRNRRDWNSKTLDYWYGRVMWTIVGLSSGIEGLARATPFRYTLVFIGVAAVVTFKGNLQKGQWGGKDIERE